MPPRPSPTSPPGTVPDGAGRALPARAWQVRAELPERPSRLRRGILWSALVGLLLVAQSLLVTLTLGYEKQREQARVEALATEAAADVKRHIGRALQDLQALTWQDQDDALPWAARARAQLQVRRELAHLERRGATMNVLDSVSSPYVPDAFGRMTRLELSSDAEQACATTRQTDTPTLSRSYFAPTTSGGGRELIDLCLPRQAAGRNVGFVVATVVLVTLLEEVSSGTRQPRHEISLVESDGSRLARAGPWRGAGSYVAHRVVDLPGRSLLLRVDSAEGPPSLIPNVAVALVLGLSLALFGVVIALVYDVRRRARVEQALAESLAFRKAMEDSLLTGLRARDLDGRITYANPAFCTMVGWTVDELQAAPKPPYWPPEQAEEYTRRQLQRLAGPDGARATREGFETLFMRRSGERFPVMIYEAPLVDAQGRHAGWMSAVLDVSEQRRVEDLSRQQQERLQATARLATIGEMASLLSHELNQPLAAIASYAAGTLNMLETPDAETPGMARQAVQRIAEQAERAGRVIKSVHDFVRRRQQHLESLSADQLLGAVLPLVRLQARKSGVRVRIELQGVDVTDDFAEAGNAGRSQAVGATGPARVVDRLRVRADRTMLEQVLLNLARNGIQAMDGTEQANRVLTLAAWRNDERQVAFSVADAGPGISADVAQRLFTPFYTTRAEGMGLGLSLCRTVVEQHGGELAFDTPWPANGNTGCRFRFTLSAATERRADEDSAEDVPAATAEAPPARPHPSPNTPRP